MARQTGPGGRRVPARGARGGNEAHPLDLQAEGDDFAGVFGAGLPEKCRCSPWSFSVLSLFQAHVLAASMALDSPRATTIAPRSHGQTEREQLSCLAKNDSVRRRPRSVRCRQDQVQPICTARPRLRSDQPFTLAQRSSSTRYHASSGPADPFGRHGRLPCRHRRDATGLNGPDVFSPGAEWEILATPEAGPPRKNKFWTVVAPSQRPLPSFAAGCFSGR